MQRKGKAKKRVAIIGYGSQGRAFALNLRDSGYHVFIGLRARSGSAKIARRDGFRQVLPIADAVKNAEIICFAFPDHLHAGVFKTQINPLLTTNKTLVFLHGTSIHFGYVKPPKNCDVLLLAPHAPGNAVRESYLMDGSLSAFYAIHQNPSGKALRTLRDLAQGIRIKPKRLLKTTFGDEAVGDMFGEQAVLCGGLALLIKNGFDSLVEYGLKPDHAYLEVAYQLDLIVSLIKKYGIAGMLNRISVTARYGSVVNGPRIIDRATKARMKRVLTEIAKGKFSNQLTKLTPKQIKSNTKSINKLTSPSLEKAAKRFSH